jgi:hypothetical protein
MNSKCADEAANQTEQSPVLTGLSQVYRCRNGIPKAPKLDHSPVRTPPISTQLTVISRTTLLLRPNPFHRKQRGTRPRYRGL